MRSWESGILFVFFISQKHVFFLLWMHMNKIDILNSFE